MKKTFGVLVLTLSSLLVSAGCASVGASSTPEPPQLACLLLVPFAFQGQGRRATRGEKVWIALAGFLQIGLSYAFVFMASQWYRVGLGGASFRDISDLRRALRALPAADSAPPVNAVE